MRKIKVSVIIPVYNAQEYLKETLDSVLKQSMQDFEIICVDDGTGDDSVSIIKRYAKNDERFVLLTQTNKGVSAARNAGIDAARGEFIYFLDSDDYVDEDTLEIACRKMEDRSLDIVYFDTVAFGEEGIAQEAIDAKNQYYSRSHNYEAVYLGKDLLCKMLENRDYSCPVWKQIIRKDFLQENQIRFYNGIIHEDELYTLQTMMLAGRVAYISKAMHHRRLRKNSIMTRPIAFDSVYGYFVCVREAYPFLLQRKCNQTELNLLLSFLKQLGVSARNQYSKLPDIEQKKYASLCEEEKFLFQICVLDSLEIMKQRDKLNGEKQVLLKEREKITKELNEVQNNYLQIEKIKEDFIKKLRDTEAALGKEREENSKRIEELQQKTATLEQMKAEAEEKLRDTEAAFGKEREENSKRIDELQQKTMKLEQMQAEAEEKLRDTEAALGKEREENNNRLEELQQTVKNLEQMKVAMAQSLCDVQEELSKEKEFNRKQLEEKLRKVSELEKVKNELRREQEFSRKQLEEKLEKIALLDRLKAETSQKINELENMIKQMQIKK